MSKEELLSQINAETATLSATKAAFKAALEARGLTPTDVFASYAPLIESITGGTIAVQDEKTVTFNGISVEIGPDEGYDGIRKVILSGDPNLKALNIVEDISLYGVKGTAKIAANDDHTTPPDQYVSEDPVDPDPGTIEDAKGHYKDKTGDDPDDLDMDIMILESNGDVTYGFLQRPGAKGNGNYLYGEGRVELPPKPEYDSSAYPFCAICSYLDDETKAVTAYRMLISSEAATYTQGMLGIGAGASLASTASFKLYDVVDGEWVESSVTDKGDRVIWADYDVPYKNGGTFLEASEPVPAGTDEFTISAYDPATTDFCAYGWYRLSYHKETDSWTFDDFTVKASTGWNYIRNVRFCSKEELYFGDVLVWKEPFGNAGWETKYTGTVVTTAPSKYGGGGASSGSIATLSSGWVSEGDYVRVTINGQKVFARCIGNAGGLIGFLFGELWLGSSYVALAYDDPADTGKYDFLVESIKAAFDSASTEWDVYLHTRLPGTYNVKIEKAVF